MEIEERKSAGENDIEEEDIEEEKIEDDHCNCTDTENSNSEQDGDYDDAEIVVTEEELRVKQIIGKIPLVIGILFYNNLTKIWTKLTFRVRLFWKFYEKGGRVLNFNNYPILKNEL
jgi:hypothetical protein